MSTSEIAASLEQAVDAARDSLLAISEEEAGRPMGPDHWSKKEILGHLIDSASNNHQRFVRLQLNDVLVMPTYQQNEWVRLQNYDSRLWRDLVELWAAYNRHLAHVIRHVDGGSATHTWKGPNADYTLGFLIEDYLGHLRHHMAQIVGVSAAA
jgi:hypothetical protein